MSPALMYSLHLDHGRLERRRLEVGPERLRRLADRLDVGQLQVGDALVQPLDQTIDPVARRLVAARRPWSTLTPDS